MAAGLKPAAWLIGAAMPAMAMAQTAPLDQAAIVATTDRAVSDADRAASAAQAASAAAADAARDARAAANQLRASFGLPPLATASTSVKPDMPAVPPKAVADTQPPADENMPLTRPGDATAPRPGFASRQDVTDTLSSSIANGANGAALKSSVVPDIQLLATSKDKVASLAWTVDISRQRNPGSLEADQLTFTATGTLDDQGNANIAGLKGYPAGSGITLAYTHYASRIVLDGREKAPVTVARQNCLMKEGKGPDASGAAAKCDPYAFKTGGGSFVAKYNPDQLQALNGEVFPGPIWFYGLSASGNQANLKYLDRAAFAVKKAAHFSYGGSLYGGVILPGGMTSLTAAFDYKRSFSPQDDVSLCQPVAATTLTQCLTAADGPPDASSSEIVSLELRRGYLVGSGSGSLSQIAIAPNLSYDIGGKAYSLDVPIYLAGDGSGKLRGGVRGIYLNEPRKGGGRQSSFELGLFVGVPFDLFSR
jgi:hypothetical protein